MSMDVNPLDGIRVVDLSQNIAGPQCTQILADLGADVIKVEPPSGDPARKWGPPFWGDEAPLFLANNRNKRSIAVDLKSSKGREVLERLVEKADVFVQAFRKGVIESLGFSCDALRQRRPELIYASITGFGSEGPLAERPGYDPLMQAYSGMMSIMGHPGTPPVRVGGAVVDMGTGMLTALGIVTALRDRDRTGQGAHIEGSLLDTALGWVGFHLYTYLATGTPPGRMGSGVAMIAPYECFATKDGHVMICGGNDRLFQRLCEALELPEVAADDRFQDNPTRVAHREELHEILESHTTEFTAAELRALLDKHGVPCSPIQDLAQVAEDPQVHANRMLEPCPHPRIPDYRNLAFPLKFGGERPAARKAPPLLGEHTKQVLGELGYNAEEIDALSKNARVVLGRS